MKKLISLILVLTMLFSLGITASAAATTQSVGITYRAIKLVLDGEQFIPCDENGKTVEPFIMNSTGTTYLPLRALAQALGLTVGWEPSTSTVTLASGGEVKTGSGDYTPSTGSKTVKITYRDIKVVLDGKQLELKNSNGDTVEPFIMNSTTYLPLRVVAEALGLNINWDPNTSTVGIAQPEKPDEPSGEGEWLISKAVYTTNIEGETGFVNEMTYHPNGKPKTDIFIDDNGTSFINKYDEKGNDIYAEYKDDASHFINEWAYDDQGREIYFSYSDPVEGYSSTETYTYGSNGQRASVVGTYTDSMGTSEWTDTYSWNGNTATITTTFPDDPDYSEVTGIYTVAFDAQGRLIKDVYSYTYGLTVINEYAYDQWGNQILRKNSATENGIDLGWDLAEWVYDANGNLLKEVYSGGSGDFSYRSTFTYTYNENGDVTHEKYEDNDGIGWDFTISYDANGNITGTRNIAPDGTTEGTYNYDENGVLVSIIDVFIGSDGSFSTTTITFEYDEYGNVIKETGRTGDDVYTYEYSYVFIGA